MFSVNALMGKQLLNSKHRFRVLQRILSVGGFSILSGLFGFGLTWLGVGIIAAFRSKTTDEFFDFAAKCMPILIAGGVIGFIVGLVAALNVARADPAKGKEIERKYVGFSGHVKIYFGVPACIITALGNFFLEKLLNKFGTQTGIYIGLGIVLAIYAICLFLYDRIRAKYIIPIGIIGWLLTILIFIWVGLVKTGAL